MVRPTGNEKVAVSSGNNNNAVAGDREKSAAPTVSTEQYTRTRDSVVTGLTNLQNAIGELIHAYLSHTNVVLGGGVGSISDTLAISNPASLAAATGGAGGVSGAGAGGTVGVFGGDGGKKKRARKERDPNAPKRPLTAYFLFAQNARGYVRRDLEAQKPDVKPGDISTESTRRWHEMDPDEQERWKSLYRQYWEEYQRQNKEYKAKFGIDVDAESEEGDENTDNDVPMTEQQALAHELLRKQFPQYMSASPAKGSKGKSKGRAAPAKETNAGENGVSAPRAGTAGAVTSTSPAPRRPPFKETPIPLPGEEVGGAGPGAAEKKKKKSGAGGHAVRDSTATPAPLDQDRDRETAEEPKRKRAKRSKGGADETVAESTGERDKEKSKARDSEPPVNTQENVAGSGSGSARKGRKRKSEGAK